MKKLCDYIRDERKKRKLTLTEFGKKLGVSAMYISHIENEHRIPTEGDVLYRLSEYFNIDIEKLVIIARFSKALRDTQDLDNPEVLGLKSVLIKILLEKESMKIKTIEKLIALVLKD